MNVGFLVYRLMLFVLRLALILLLLSHVAKTVTRNYDWFVLHCFV
jgi:hypothetical protein